VSPIKTLKNWLNFLHVYLLFYYNFLTVLIMRVGMLKGINFNSGLNIYDTIVFSDPIPYKGTNIVAILQHAKQFLAYFLCTCAQTSELVIRFGDPNFL